jgi:hypothetical protein
VPCEVCVNQTAVFRAGQAGAQNLRALFAAGLDRLLELNVKRWRCVMCQPEKASNVNSYTYTHSDCGKPADSCTMPFASALIRLCLAAPASASLSQICNPIYNEQMSHLPDCPNRARVSGQANVRKGRDFLGHLVQIRIIADSHSRRLASRTRTLDIHQKYFQSCERSHRKSPILANRQS